MIKRYCISIGITALLYFAVAKLVFSSLQLGLEPAPLWPPAGIALFVLLQQGRLVWPGVAIGILMVGQWLGIDWLLAIGSAAGGTLEAVIGATLLRWIGFRQTMDRLRDVLGLIGLAGLMAPLLSATISTGTAVLMGQLREPLTSQIWWTIWLGNSMGILVFTPLLLMTYHWLNHRPRLPVQQWFQQWLQQPRSLETLLCFSLLISSSWLVFHSQPHGDILHYPIEYLPLPFVIWAALRLGQAPGIVASFLLCLIAMSGTAADRGPFVTAVDAPRQLILLQQAFLGVTTMTALMIGVMAAEQQRISALLRRSQTNLAKAQEIASLGSWEFDFAQQQWSWSDQLYRLLGFSVQQVVPSQVTFLQAVHPDDRAEVEQTMTRAFTHRLPYRTDYRLKLADGTERTVEEQISVSETTATGTILDITEFKQTEQKLRINAESNRLLSEIALRIRKSLDLEEILNTTVEEVRQFLQADRVFICQFDAAGQGEVVAESVLPGWTSALGWTSPQAVYPEIQAVFTDAPVCRVDDTSNSEYTPFIQDYHERYQVRAGIGVALVTDGNQRQATPAPARLTGLLIAHQCSHPRQWQPLEIELLEQLAVQVTIAIQQGQLYRQVQHLNNNLEQQVAERTLQLQVNLAKLEEMNQLQGVFLHAIAHDLRTTMMGTLMVLNHMQQQTGDQISMSRSTLNRMVESGNIQFCKLNSLLEAYNNRTEGVVLNRVPTHIYGLLQTVTTDLQSLFEQNQTQVSFQTDAEDLILMADPAKLERVLRHLLVNAVKHNPPRTQVQVQAEVQSEMLHVTVADNGKGIAPAEAKQLFELKIRQGEDRQRLGIGVGLCLCNQIITAHGGAIGVESIPEQGSRFWFTLPLGGTVQPDEVKF